MVFHVSYPVPNFTLAYFGNHIFGWPIVEFSLPCPIVNAVSKGLGLSCRRSVALLASPRPRYLRVALMDGFQ